MKEENWRILNWKQRENDKYTEENHVENEDIRIDEQ
jgi:hypothetical protein